MSDRTKKQLDDRNQTLLAGFVEHVTRGLNHREALETLSQAHYPYVSKSVITMVTQHWREAHPEPVSSLRGGGKAKRSLEDLIIVVRAIALDLGIEAESAQWTDLVLWARQRLTTDSDSPTAQAS